MDLFVINRYEGEEPIKSVAAENHLSFLLKKIEERKREKLAVTAENKKVDIQIDVGSTSRKKGKKRKSSRKKEIADVSVDEPEKSDVPRVTEQPEEKIDESSKTDDNFMILGTESKKKIKAVRRVLPKWLSQPEIISANLNSGPPLDDFRELLDEETINVLQSNGLRKLFPVQATIVKWLTKCDEDRKKGWWPRDTCVSAPTGSGKTLAYVLPIIRHLRSRLAPKIRCLVVLPVQELAAQVYKVFVAYSGHTNLRVALISGASSFEAEQCNLVKKSQRGESTSRVDIVIATPGRLIDHIEKTDGFSLNDLQYIVIDEADRSTDWLQYIPPPHSRAPPLTLANVISRWRSRPAQKLLFSATLSQDPEKLSRLGLFRPILFTSVLIKDRDDDVNLDDEIEHFAGRYTSPDELKERAVECDAEYKPIAVYRLIADNPDVVKTLVFTNSGETAHRLAILLRSLFNKCREDVVVDELSAQLAPKQRAAVLKKFANGEVSVLVSSDALARGLDIPGVKLVVAYDLPKHIEGYIHRAGRTARAGVSGTAVSVLTSGQLRAFEKMLNSAMKAPPTIERLDGLDKIAAEIDYESHIDGLKNRLMNEQTIFLEKGKKFKRNVVNSK